MHIVISARRRVLRRLPTKAADVRSELPYLVIRKFAAEGWHPVRPSLDNGRKDLIGLAAVDPFVVHQWRPNASSAVEMATHAIHLLVEAFALGKGVGIVLVFVLELRCRGRLACL